MISHHIVVIIEIDNQREQASNFKNICRQLRTFIVFAFIFAVNNGVFEEIGGAHPEDSRHNYAPLIDSGNGAPRRRIGRPDCRR